MRGTREHFILARRRIRRVLDYLERHLDSEDIGLDTLAGVANLSRYHFERSYQQCVGETPMATLRRLRLLRARKTLLAGTPLSITDLALQAGYGSIAAFSRAFSRQFAIAPSLVLPSPAPAGAALEIVQLSAVPVWRQPFSGRAAEVFAAGDDFSWRLSRGGARRWRHWVVHPDGWVDPARWPDTWVRMWHCVPQAGLPPRLPGVEHGLLPAGDYACFRQLGPQAESVARLIARIPLESDWQLRDGPMLRHYPNVTDFTLPSERCTLFFLPVAPAGKRNSNPDQNPLVALA